MTRIEFHNYLKALPFLEGVEIYFQPPEGRKIKYPALIYNIGGFERRLANNGVYSLYVKYALVYIYSNPDDPAIKEFAANSAFSVGQPYVSAGLYHLPVKVYKLFN